MILGMDQLSEHYAFIDCRDKKVIFEIPREGTCYYEGVRFHTPEAVSTRMTCMMIEATSKGYLVSMQEVTQEMKKIADDIAVVQDFLDVFPKIFQGYHLQEKQILLLI